MDNATIISLVIFSHVAAYTPGPNNLMLAASGSIMGYRTIPHISGVTAGFMLLVFAAGLGLSSLFTALPQLYNVMRV